MELHLRYVESNKRALKSMWTAKVRIKGECRPGAESSRHRVVLSGVAEFKEWREAASMVKKDQVKEFISKTNPGSWDQM